MTNPVVIEFPSEPPGGLDARFCEVMNAAPVMIWVSGVDRGCVWFNRPWLAFTGRSIAQERGTGWAEGVHRDDFSDCFKHYVSQFDARNEFRMQYRLRRYDGAYRWIDDTGIPRYAHDGRFLGYIGSCIDIHEHRQTQAELHRRLLEIVHLNRQADAAALAATIAHELNQPLGAISSNAETAEIYLAREPPDADQVKEIIADIRRDNLRAAQAIARMQKLLARKTFEPEKIDINDIVDMVHRILSPWATDMEIVFSVDRQQRALPVLAEPPHLQQAVLNLAMNGLHATKNNMTGQRRTVLQTTISGRSAVEVSIADSGHGIAADELQCIFDPMFKGNRRGTGLGLSIARTIVESYGGRIWAENRAGGGAVFRFTLPLVEGHA